MTNSESIVMSRLDSVESWNGIGENCMIITSVKLKRPVVCEQVIHSVVSSYPELYMQGRIKN